VIVRCWLCKRPVGEGATNEQAETDAITNGGAEWGTVRDGSHHLICYHCLRQIHVSFPTKETW